MIPYMYKTVRGWTYSEKSDPMEERKFEGLHDSQSKKTYFLAHGYKMLQVRLLSQFCGEFVHGNVTDFPFFYTPIGPKRG